LLTIPIAVKSQNDSLAKRLLEIEMRLFKLGDLTQNSAIELLTEKVKIYSALNQYEKVIEGITRIEKNHIGIINNCDLINLKFEAFVRSNRSFELIKEMKKQETCLSNKNTISLRALIYLENERFEDFAIEISKLNKALGDSFLIALKEFNLNTDVSNRNWLPAWYFSQKRTGKGLTTLAIHSLPPATLAAGIIFSLPVSGVILGGYLGWRIYGNQKSAITNVINKESRQRAISLTLAGFTVLEKITSSTEFQSCQPGIH